jgi:hypothetical protein
MNAKAVNGKENKNPTKRSSVIDASRASRDKKNANDPANNNSKIAKKKTSAAGYLYAGDKENVRTSIPKPARYLVSSLITDSVAVEYEHLQSHTIDPSTESADEMLASSITFITCNILFFNYSLSNRTFETI